MSILKEIYVYKLDFVKNQKKILSQKVIENSIIIGDKKNYFYKKLRDEDNQISIIGEIKRASPSLGEFIDNNINIMSLIHTLLKNESILPLNISKILFAL